MHDTIAVHLDVQPQRREQRADMSEPFEVEPIGQCLALIEDNSGNLIELAQAIGA